MADEVSRSEGPDEPGGPGPAWLRTVRIAFVVAVTAVCLGGAAAIVAASRGASTADSLFVLAASVVCGLLVAGLVMLRAARRPRTTTRETRLARKADQAREAETAARLEQALSARYGVPVTRVAWHVWQIKGELVEATLDPATGRLITGGRELSL